MCRGDRLQEGAVGHASYGVQLRTSEAVMHERCSDSQCVFDLDDDGEGVVWGRSGVKAEDYTRRRGIWKHVIKGVGQMFSSADSFRYTIWKYAIANRLDYYFVRNCRQRIAVKCTAE